MGRTRQILREAKPTTISLTDAQSLAVEELQLKRRKEGKPKPGLTQVMLEGFCMLLIAEGWPAAELEKIFPAQKLPKATVRVMPKRRQR